MTTGARPTVDPPADDVMLAVRDSVLALSAPSSTFPAVYYAELIALVPAILQTSGDHGHAVADALARHVFEAATSTDPPDVIAGRLRRAGAELLAGGFPPDGYQGAAHAVLRAARDCYPHDWDSTLSSAWVAWLGWAGDRMLDGARAGRPVAVQVLPVAAPTVAGGVPATLAEVFAALRDGPFAGNPRALDSVATRIALRTGADLRFPRMDQQSDPALVAVVLAALSRMGYAVAGIGADGPVDPSAVPRPVAVAPAGDVAAARHGRAGTGTPPTVDPSTGAVSLPADDAFGRPRRARWWNRLLRTDPAAPPAAAGSAVAPGPVVTPGPAVADDVPGPRVPSPAGRRAGTAPRGTFDAFSRLGDDPARAVSGPGGPGTLTEILDRLRRHTFADNDWALDGVLTRVALRTGADIRAPRPDQVADPGVVRDVLAVLDRMGYGEVADAAAPSVPAQRPRWWSRPRRRDRPPSLDR